MLKFYMDHELAALWPQLDEFMYDTEWRMYVFAFRTMLCLGSRLWETTQIRVEDCHADYVHIRFGKGEGIIRGEYKERYADVHPTIYGPYYREYIDSLPADQEWLFPRRRVPRQWGKKAIKLEAKSTRRLNRKTVHISTIEKRWALFCDMIGLRYLSCHEAFRKSFATWFHDELRRHEMMDQLGHRDYRTTDRIYRGSIPGRRFTKPTVEWKELAKQMGAALEKKRARHLRVVGGNT